MAKNESVNEYMRARLLVNRHGKLTSEQWKDMVTEPLVTLAVLLIPGVFVLGPRLGALMWGGFGLLALAAVAALGVTLALRARRYARAPVHFAVLQGGEETPPFWAVWKPIVLYQDDGTPVRFNKRLAPYTPLQRGSAYMVYYLQDATANVLLSLAPADHPDADLWQPSTAFQERIARDARR